MDMSAMIVIPRYTTPVLTFTFEQELPFDLREMAHVWMTIISQGDEIEMADGDLDIQEDRVLAKLTQEISGRLHVGRAAIQLNFTDVAGNRWKAGESYVQVTENFHDEVI
jgi:hypothetical protein